MNALFLWLLELQMIIILYYFPGNSTALKIFHDLPFKKKKKQQTKAKTLSMHKVLRVFLFERGQINKITYGQ